jgi:hypothetical protein
MTDETTKEQYMKIGKTCRDALDGNFLVGAFAADLAGEGYPLSKEMWDVLFKAYADYELGIKFFQWIQERGKDA